MVRLETSAAHEAVEGRTGHARELGDGGLGKVQLRGRDPQIGKGFHGLTMEYSFLYFI